MLSTIPVLAASMAGLAAAAELQQRQAPTATSSLNRTPEGTPIPLEDTINAICQPTFYIWDRGTLDQQRASGLDRYDSREEMELSLKDSPFPCERAMYLQSSCLTSIWDEDGWEDVTDKGVEEERECFCESEAWDLMEGCRQCNAVHGYGSDSEYIVKREKEMEWLETKFCNGTVPERNYYWLVNGNEHFELFGHAGDGYRTGEFGEEDETGGKTDVSYYWTVSASRTASGGASSVLSGEGSETVVSETRTLTAATTINAKATDTTGIVTPTSIGGSATATETQASAVSSAAGAASSSAASQGGANEVRVGGGLVMAVLGAMALL